MIQRAAFASGVLFGAGLVVAGATNPGVVLGFLDVAGEWNPQLLFMFAGGVLSYALLHRLGSLRASPLFAAEFDAPVRKQIDRRLILGAIVFGVGWGLAGICPGPAFTSLAAGGIAPVVFTITMLAGMLGYERILGAGRRPAARVISLRAQGETGMIR